MAATKTSSRRRRYCSETSPEVLWWMEQHGFEPTEVQPKFRTPEPDYVKGAVFVPERVDKVLAALRCLRHTTGQWRGQPFEPSSVQIQHLIAPVFGWCRVDPDTGEYTRIVRSVYWDVPRKFGKTFTASGLALYLAFGDSEPGAQVIAGAASRDQARRCFDPAALIVKHSPELRAAGVRALRSRIQRDSDMSTFDVASAEGDLLHGSSPNGFIVDELHVFKNSSVIDALESGTGARRQPLGITITTADDGRPGTVYAQRREQIEKLAKRVVKDPTSFGVVFAADDKDDPFREETWKKANPHYPVTPSRAFMESEAAKAQSNPVNLARFKRLHLGLRTNEEKRFISLDVWRRNAGFVDEEKLRGKTAFGGLDLSSTSDLTALCWLFPDDNGGYDAVWRHWIPERAFHQMNERTAGSAEVWKREGWLTVLEGDVIDYAFVRHQIGRDLEKFDVQAIAFDRWNSSTLVQQLMDDGAPMVQLGQGFTSLSGPLKEINHVLLTGSATTPKLRTGGNKLMEWEVSHLAVSSDPAGNVKPDRKKASDKIDGIAALVDAMAASMVEPAEPKFVSAYETHGVEVI